MGCLTGFSLYAWLFWVRELLAKSPLTNSQLDYPDHRSGVCNHPPVVGTQEPQLKTHCTCDHSLLWLKKRDSKKTSQGETSLTRAIFTRARGSYPLTPDSLDAAEGLGLVQTQPLIYIKNCVVVCASTCNVSLGVSASSSTHFQVCQRHPPVSPTCATIFCPMEGLSCGLFFAYLWSFIIFIWYLSGLKQKENCGMETATLRLWQ